MRRWRLLFVLLAVFGLIAAACGNDSDDGDDGGDTAGQTDTGGDDGSDTDGDDGSDTDGGDTDGDDGSDTDGGDTDGDDGSDTDGGDTDGDDGSDTDGDDGGSAGAPGPGEVAIDPDTGRLVAGPCAEGDNNEDADLGVTADTVNVAVVGIDFGPLADLGFAASDEDFPALTGFWEDAINANGGVCGRQLDVQKVNYDILAGEGGAACLQVTEDRRNAIVFGQGGWNEATCVAEAGTLIVGQQDFSVGQVESAGGDKGLLFSRQLSVEDTYIATTKWYIDQGYMDGKKVGVWYGAVFLDQGDAVENEVFPLLDEAGIDYIPFRTDTIGPSDPEGNAILQSAAGEFVSNGVEVVLGFTQTTNHVGMQGELAARGLTPQYLWSNVGSNSSNELFAETFAVTDIADGEKLMTYTIPQQTNGTPPNVSCNEELVSLGGPEFTEGEFNFAGGANMCHQMDLLVALLTVVGPEITQDGLIEALENMPRHPMALMLDGEQFAPGERFGSTVMAEQTYDGGANTYTITGDIFDIGDI